MPSIEQIHAAVISRNGNILGKKIAVENALERMRSDAMLGVFYDRFDPYREYQANYRYGLNNGLVTPNLFYSQWFENEILTIFKSESKEGKAWLKDNYSQEHGGLLHELVAQIAGAIFTGNNFRVMESEDVRAKLDSVFDGSFQGFLKDKLLPFILFNPNGYVAIIEDHEKPVEVTEKYKASVELVRIFDVLFESNTAFGFQCVEEGYTEYYTLAAKEGQFFQSNDTAFFTFPKGSYFENLPVMEVPSLETNDIGRSYFSDYIDAINSYIKAWLETEYAFFFTTNILEKIETACPECNGSKGFEKEGEWHTCASCNGRGHIINGSPRSVNVILENKGFDKDTPTGSRWINADAALLGKKHEILTQKYENLRKKLYLSNGQKATAETAAAKLIDYNGFINLCNNVAEQLHKTAKFVADYVLGIENGLINNRYVKYDTKIQKCVHVEINSLRDTLNEFLEVQKSGAVPAIVRAAYENHVQNIKKGNEYELKKQKLHELINPFMFFKPAELINLGASEMDKKMYYFGANAIEELILEKGQDYFTNTEILTLKNEIISKYTA